ncbi:FK506-binding protein-like [Sphaeramia orbicularis]|uniref:Uncharacterized protein n=1 Tax=Sphaeramia orbicularis TaxID=375764 RepID=A0A673BGB9_9TELE|nr:FK506-binding protein-like [Sphaeramia orbicularis]
MDPVKTSHGSDDSDTVHVTSWVSVCPRGPWKVQKKPTKKNRQQMCSSLCDTSCPSHPCPRLGSLCQVRVQLKAATDKEQSSVSGKGNEQPSDKPAQSTPEIRDDMATPFPRCRDSVLQVPLGDWTILRLGEGQCDVTEACLEGMKAGEKCEIHLSPVENGSNVSSGETADANLSLCATVELQTFTPGKESWEMSPAEKLEWVKSHKEKGGERFRSGDVWGAADSYSRALKLLITLDGHVRELDKKGQVQEEDEQRDTNPCETTEQQATDCPVLSASKYKTIKAELHSNLSLCQLKLNQPQCARASAAKATQLEPGGAKAWYRLGQACQMMNDLEEARKAFRKLLELQPDSSAALKALKDVANKEKETNAELGLRLSKMFS